MPFLLMILMMNNNLKFLALAALINGTCFSMILPVLAPLTRQLHLSEFQGGLIVSAGAICMAIASIWIAKNKSNRSPNQLVNYGFWGMTFTWAIFTLILYLGTQGILPTLLIFTLLVFSRASTGIFMALPQIGLQSYVMSHALEADERSKQMAMFGAMNSFGMIIGPFATSILLFGGLLFPMWIAVALLAFVSIALSIFFGKTPLVQSHVSTNKVEESSSLDNEPILKQSLIWLALGFVTYVAIVTLNMTVGFYIQDTFYLTSQQSAVYFAQCMLVVGVCLVLSQFLIVNVFQLKLNSLVVIGLVTMCCGLLLSLYAPTIFAFQASYIFYGVSVACLLPAFTTGAAQAVSQQSQVKMASFCTAAQALGLVVGPLLSTFLYRFSTYFPFYLLLLLTMSIGLYFCWILLCKEHETALLSND